MEIAVGELLDSDKVEDGDDEFEVVLPEVLHGHLTICSRSIPQALELRQDDILRFQEFNRHPNSSTHSSKQENPKRFKIEGEMIVWVSGFKKNSLHLSERINQTRFKKPKSQIHKTC